DPAPRRLVGDAAIFGPLAEFHGYILSEKVMKINRIFSCWQPSCPEQPHPAPAATTAAGGRR
ncbi:hypothetical protein AB1398_02525, partial [Hydrogenibacillus schlegelii]